MKQREKTATGLIDKSGRLSMYMGELNEFFSGHKNKKVVATFTIIDTAKTSEPLKAYYFKYVVPTFKSAIWESGERKTDEQTEKFLREMSPIMWEQTPVGGRYQSRLMEINELSNAQLIEHIETLKQIGAEEYGIYIDDPKTY